MPCDHECPSSLLGPERVICGTYRDSSGRVCHAPLKCSLDSDGEYVLTVDVPRSNVRYVSHIGGLKIHPGKPGVSYHIVSILYSITIGETPWSNESPGSMKVAGNINGHESFFSDVSVFPDTVNHHQAILDTPDIVLDPGSPIYLHAFSGIITVRYREVIV